MLHAGAACSRQYHVNCTIIGKEEEGKDGFLLDLFSSPGASYLLVRVYPYKHHEQCREQSDDRRHSVEHSVCVGIPFPSTKATVLHAFFVLPPIFSIILVAQRIDQDL